MDQSFFYAAMLAVAGHDPDEPQRGKAATFFVSTIPVYKTQCDQHGDIARRDWVHLSRMYNYLGAEHMTNWANHVCIAQHELDGRGALARISYTRDHASLRPYRHQQDHGPHDPTAVGNTSSPVLALGRAKDASHGPDQKLTLASRYELFGADMRASS